MITKELNVSNDYFLSKLDKKEGISLEKEYLQLIKVINLHNELYYQQNNPIITDYQYDMLFNMLKNFEEIHPELITTLSPTQKLTNQIQKNFKKAINKIPLLSLENSYDNEDIKKWINSIKKTIVETNKENNFSINFSIEPKFDGLSIALTYEYGYLTKAITRGNGKKGEDVTENVKQIANVPNFINSFLNFEEIILRGEIVMPKSVFNKLNNTLSKPFSNPRNAASGSLKQLDTNITKQRELACYIYDIILLNYNSGKNLSEDEYRLITTKNLLNNGLTTQDKILMFLSNAGLPVLSLKNDNTPIIGNIDTILKFTTKEAQEYMENLDVEFDGVVLKLNQVKYRDILGETGHHIKWGLAYKFPAKQYITKLLSVSYQVGRTGIITPVANLETIDIDGVKVSRASLHNFEDIKLKDIELNDYVIVQRSGEVIPYILGSVKERRGNDTEEILPPDNCPICGGKAKGNPGLVGHYCINNNCIAKIEGKIIFFVGKGGLDIKGFGEETAKKFIKEGFIKSLSDVFKISQYQNDIIKIDGFGKKKFDILLKGLENSKNSELWKIIESFGIHLIGGTAGKMIEELIVNDYNNKNKDLSKFNVDELIYYFNQTDLLRNIDGFGEKMVESLSKVSQDISIINEMKELEKIGLKFNNFNRILKKKKIIKSNTINIKEGGNNGNSGMIGTTFSITGSFDISRPKIVEMLENKGMIFHKSPKKDTNIMIIGEKAGSKKDKAEKIGCKIINNYKDLL